MDLLSRKGAPAVPGKPSSSSGGGWGSETANKSTGGGWDDSTWGDNNKASSNDHWVSGQDSKDNVWGQDDKKSGSNAGWGIADSKNYSSNWSPGYTNDNDENRGGNDDRDMVS